MNYAIELVDGRTAWQAVALLGGGNLAGAVDRNRLIFETLEHAQWAKRQLEREEFAGLTIAEEQGHGV